MDGDDYTLTAQDKQDIAELVDVPVDDVQINGTSIVQDGVANVPIAVPNTNTFGVVKVKGANGISINNSQELTINPANLNAIKAGTSTTYPITVSHQHESAFYALAKAAGDTSQSQSSNAVGEYTEDAKIAIQKMLGIYQHGELIADITATEDVTEFSVTTDLNGLAFELKKMIVIFAAGVSTTGTRDAFYAQAFFTNRQGGAFNTSCPSLTYPTATSEMFARLTIDVFDEMPLIPTAVVATGDGNTQNVLSMVKQNIAKNIKGIRIYQSGATKSLIPAGSNIKVYGIRA